MRQVAPDASGIQTAAARDREPSAGELRRPARAASAATAAHPLAALGVTWRDLVDQHAAGVLARRSPVDEVPDPATIGELVLPADVCGAPVDPGAQVALERVLTRALLLGGSGQLLPGVDGREIGRAHV